MTYNFNDGTSYTCPGARCSKADRDSEHLCCPLVFAMTLVPLHCTVLASFCALRCSAHVAQASRHPLTPAYPCRPLQAVSSTWSP